MACEIFGVPFDDLSPNQLDAVLRGWVRGGEPKQVFTPNAEFLLKARKEPRFADLLKQADLSLPDTVSLRYASAAYGEPLRFRHTGVDTLTRLAKICNESGKRLLLFGGEGDIAKKAARELRKKYTRLDVAGINPGIVENVQSVEKRLLEEINDFAPCAAAVALTFGKQERFISTYIHHIPSLRVAIGVGGALDMISGKRPRAPQRVRKAGFEWVWRVLIEPRRVKRIVDASLRFPAVVAYDTFKRREFFRSCGRVFPEVFRQLQGK